MNELEYLKACPFCWLIRAWIEYDGIEMIVQTRSVCERNLVYELYERNIRVVI